MGFSIFKNSHCSICFQTQQTFEMTSNFLLSIAAVCFLSQAALAADCTIEQLTAVTDFFNSTELLTSINACQEATGAGGNGSESETITVAKEMCGNSDCKAVIDSFAAFDAPDCTIEGTSTNLKTQNEPIFQQAVDSWAQVCDGAASTTLSLMLLFFCAMIVLNN